MACSSLPDDELAALRRLEAAVRACGLPTMMVSGQKQLDALAKALKEVDDARNKSIAGSARPGFSPCAEQQGMEVKMD
ncbi:MAG TPA: hypothetical protein VJ698_10715 [Noviherbaspirillum sp.]|uniref:hypothetical protein n=1 Tax=Noviherbaspirillum sp. TaxID=1926288 RepID=UPI002B4990BA|nr:hypothetical protein [Noviherbaspirillum sp.]HJV85938.1 hypothetical protein [Noviherbaspirillum sp.]